MSAILQDIPELRHGRFAAPSRQQFQRPAPATPQPRFAPPVLAADVGRPRTALILLRFALTTMPLIAADVLSVSLCGCVAAALLHVFVSAQASTIGWRTPFVLISLSLAYWPAGLYPGIGLHPVVELRQLTKVNTIALLAATVAGYLTLHRFALPAYFVLAWLISLPLVPFGRILTRKLCARRGWWGFPALVISSGDTAARVVRTMLDSPHGGLRPAAVFDPAQLSPVRVGCVPVLESTAVIDFLRDHSIRHALVSLPEMSRRDMSELLGFCSSRIPHVLVVSNLSGLPSLWSTARSCGGLNGLEYRNGLMLVLPRMVKRFIDVTVTLVVVALASPLFAMLGALVKLTSRGPVFYGHTRLGLEGKPFKAWKFRSMYTDGDRFLKEHLANNTEAREEWERDQKLRDDPRVTPLGKVLRRLSLDELPQLWNVLKGDMSLVGPRPIVNDEIAKYGRVFHLYTGVKPGITGLWQVSGRNETTYEQRVRMDQYYVRNWSPWLDVYILCKTVSVVIKRQGAY
jgi:Undecaprenyl-phosphate galactose phosphotransferase WbaP